MKKVIRIILIAAFVLMSVNVFADSTLDQSKALIGEEEASSTDGKRNTAVQDGLISNGMTRRNNMTTKDTIQGYFNSLKQKKGWESFLSDEMIFTSFTSPMKQVTGKNEYLEATKRFYSMVMSVEVKDLMIEGEKVCALTHYELKPPSGNIFSSDVAEIFTVKNGKIDSFDIYFDSSPFPK